MKGFLYCFRLEIAVVGAYLWEICVRKKGNNFYCSIICAYYTLLFNPTFHAMPSMFSKCFKMIVFVFFYQKYFICTVQSRSIILYYC